MSKRSVLMTREAELIAAKLDAEVSEGRKHTRAVVRLNGQFVGQFGIRRGTNLGHDIHPQANPRDSSTGARLGALPAEQRRLH